jgi:hypothetical protein
MLALMLQFRFAEPQELFPGTVIGHSYTTGSISEIGLEKWP